MRYHIILENKGKCRQLSQRAERKDRAVARARKLAQAMLEEGKELTNTSTGGIIKEYTEVYVVESDCVKQNCKTDGVTND